MARKRKAGIPLEIITPILDEIQEDTRASIFTLMGTMPVFTDQHPYVTILYTTGRNLLALGFARKALRILEDAATTYGTVGNPTMWAIVATRAYLEAWFRDMRPQDFTEVMNAVRKERLGY